MLLDGVYRVLVPERCTVDCLVLCGYDAVGETESG